MLNFKKKIAKGRLVKVARFRTDIRVRRSRLHTSPMDRSAKSAQDLYPPCVGALEREPLCHTYLHLHNCIALYKHASLSLFFQCGTSLLAFPPIPFQTLSNTPLCVSISHSPNHHFGRIIYRFEALTNENKTQYSFSSFLKWILN